MVNKGNFIIKTDAKGFHVFENIAGNYLVSTNTLKKANAMIKILVK